MRKFLITCLYCLVLTRGYSQDNNSILLNEVMNYMENGNTDVSSVLSAKKYLPLHPLTTFRELIKNYSSASILMIAPTDEPGKKIRVLCTVTDKDGAPVPGAIVYMYQTDAKGWYAADAPHVLANGGDVGHARLFGYVKTDVDGKFELNTIKPNGYPNSDLPAHIHVHVEKEGYRAYVNEFLFDDDDRLVGDIRESSIRNSFMISKPEKVKPPFDQQFTYKIVLGK